MSRVYLDHNATYPLRPEAREAMLAAMDLVGNPSSVHAEGRAAKALIEKARAQVAAAFGADGADIVFTSGATEAAGIAFAAGGFEGAGIEHDAVGSRISPVWAVDADGIVTPGDVSKGTLQLANSETGVIQTLPEGLYASDATQAFGKIPVAFNWMGCQMALISGHKLGAPKGIGALVMKRGTDVQAQMTGGGQEMGRRAGTENLLGIVGFGAAAEAAMAELDSGAWDRVRDLRDAFEARVLTEAEDVVIAGANAPRLPNTSYLVSPGWKGETQVMQMDLKGFAVSAGSACSSGKVRESKVLKAMGYDDRSAGGALRVSLGVRTTEDEIMRFADAWLAQRDKHRARAA
ncbi:cysteine desulfurase family protein [Pseudooceanicola onchidii]|uniref:cysteine desulfurase family protein n=1 Tax=Pseudooceanicola onchidii TaxID=2562279 RepID=UPI0010AB08EB|nr:cysteine desulfurase family protein [Pseudooceanicola onchidii]